MFDTQPVLDTIRACVQVCGDDAYDMVGIDKIDFPVADADHLIVTLEGGQKIKITAELVSP